MDQEGLNYYKSLVTDSEVIEALIKESKARDGELEKSRLKPNLNFFQRTVSNMVSSNKRITKKQEQIIAKEKERNTNYRPKKVPVRKKLPIELIQEILSNKINFVKSSDKTKYAIKEVEVKGKPSDRKRKTPFQLMREVLTDQVQFDNVEETKRSSAILTDSSSSGTSDQCDKSSSKHKKGKSKDKIKFTKRKRRKDSNSDSEVSIISLSDSSNSSISVVNLDANDVIRISDSDSSDTCEKYRRKKRK